MAKTTPFLALTFCLLLYLTLSVPCATGALLAPFDTDGITGNNVNSFKSLSGYGSVNAFTPKRSYIHFDLTQIPESFTFASLDLSIQGVDEGASLTISSYNADGSISTNEWGAGQFATSQLIAYGNSNISIDLSANIRAAKQNNWLYYGLELSSNDGRFFLYDSGYTNPIPKISVIPEPSTMCITAIGIAMLLTRRTRRQKKLLVPGV